MAAVVAHGTRWLGRGITKTSKLNTSCQCLPCPCAARRAVLMTFTRRHGQQCDCGMLENENSRVVRATPMQAKRVSATLRHQERVSQRVSRADAFQRVDLQQALQVFARHQPRAPRAHQRSTETLEWLQLSTRQGGGMPQHHKLVCIVQAPPRRPTCSKSSTSG